MIVKNCISNNIYITFGDCLLCSNKRDKFSFACSNRVLYGLTHLDSGVMYRKNTHCDFVCRNVYFFMLIWIYKFKVDLYSIFHLSVFENTCDNNQTGTHWLILQDGCDGNRISISVINQSPKPSACRSIGEKTISYGFNYFLYFISRKLK